MTVRKKTSARAESVAKRRLRMWLKLLKSGGLIKNEVSRRLRKEHNTTLPRFDVMSALARRPDGMKMNEISKLLRVSNGNITGIVDNLTNEGLALRLAVQGDRRAHLVRLTPRGESVFAEQAKAHQIWVDEIFGDIDIEDIDDMIDRLDHLNDFLEMKGNENEK